MIADKLPELLDFSKDLASIEPATKVQYYIFRFLLIELIEVELFLTDSTSKQIQLKFLAEEMQAVNKGLEKVVQELCMSENDGPISDEFWKVLIRPCSFELNFSKFQFQYFYSQFQFSLV